MDWHKFADKEIVICMAKGSQEEQGQEEMLDQDQVCFS